MLKYLCSTKKKFIWIRFLWGKFSWPFIYWLASCWLIPGQAVTPGNLYWEIPGFKPNSTLREERKDFSVQVHLNKYFSASVLPSTWLSSILSTFVVYLSTPIQLSITWTDLAHVQAHNYVSLNFYHVGLWWWSTEKLHCNVLMFTKGFHTQQHPVLFLFLRCWLKEDLKYFI